MSGPMKIISRGLLFCFLGLLVSCAQMVGDECTYSSSDCPKGTFCDASMPGGYCTKTPCHQATEDMESECPEESICVEFSNGETYCMLDCSSDGDCREDYKCISENGSPKFCGVSGE
jgi:hypothetical protein